jgi:hypothetical protein
MSLLAVSNISLAARQRLALFILILAGGMAMYVAIPGDGIGQAVQPSLGGGIGLIDRLNAVEWVHLVSHWAVFGSVAFLLGEWGAGAERGSAGLAWRYVVVGSLLMEGGQALVGYADDTPRTLVESILFDLAMNALGASMGLALLYRLTRWYKPSSDLVS